MSGSIRVVRIERSYHMTDEQFELHLKAAFARMWQLADDRLDKVTMETLFLLLDEVILARCENGNE